ncbi:MAG: nucleotide modification associated domain-containing protein [Candidatus Thermoplasmatota archaeon]|nr:nucleotide modification associated domain-containing protein [Candidatus Thermoplasmatota archaeon]
MTISCTNRPGHPLFYKLLEQMADLHARKNQNYAEAGDPLSNLKGCARIGLSPLTGVIVRLQDKWSRIEQLVKGQPDLVGESLEDTLIDSAIYALLAIILLREAQAEICAPNQFNP